MAAVQTTVLGDRLDVRLLGRLDETHGREVQETVRGVLKRRDIRFVVVHLEQLEECTILGRSLLIEMQTDIARWTERSAWISNSPRFRGLALWVIHACSDGNANVAPNEVVADRWLGSRQTLLTDIGSEVERRIAEIKKKRRGGGRSRGVS